jgi:CofD-related protein of GAK system
MSRQIPRFPIPPRDSLPNRQRIERDWPSAQEGPRVLFFSGGSALRETSGVLKGYTHNSIHLITPFDSGGSSAVLRQAFDILGLGDLRNRLLALADESVPDQPQVTAVFSHRFPATGDERELRDELRKLADGDHALVRNLRSPLREVVSTNLGRFIGAMPEDFDLRLASIGNLILTGGYLERQADLGSVLTQFSELVSARGIVRPVVTESAHLIAIHENGQRTIGQHNIGSEQCVARGPIADLELTSSLEEGQRLELDADRASLELIESAELIVFSMGSFFGSVLANLLPRGIGRAVLASDAPRIYVPNCGHDPEMHGRTVNHCASKIAELIGRDAETQSDVDAALDFVIVDSHGLHYDSPLDLPKFHAAGVQVIDVDLATDTGDRIDPRKLSEVLLTLVP